jgi:AraC-like DNA-binding protein
MDFDAYEIGFPDSHDAVAEWSGMMLNDCGLHCECDRLRSAGSVIKRWMLGQVEVSRVDLSAHVLSPAGESESSPYTEWLFVKLVRAGHITVEQAGERRRFDAGSLLAFDPARGFTESIPERAQMIVLRIPKARLRERGLPHSLRGVLACNMRSPDVIAASELIHCIADQADAPSLVMRSHLGGHLLDLMNVVLTDQSDSTKWRSAAATLFRAKNYIARHLGNDELDAFAIAAATHVSVKHLQRLFNRDGVPMMRYVWQARLERAERLLRASTVRPVSVQEIAYRCGFRSPAHFSRAFKERFGVSPRNVDATRG